MPGSELHSKGQGPKALTSDTDGALGREKALAAGLGWEAFVEPNVYHTVC